MGKGRRRFLRHRGMQVGVVLLGLLVGLVIAGPLVRDADPDAPVARPLLPPSAEHPFGTDYLGRDTMARICSGGGFSIGIGLASVALSLLVGVPLGGMAGYFGGRTDFWISRGIDAMLSIPTVLLAICISVWLGPGTGTVVVAVGVVGIPQIARQVRGSVLVIGQSEFVAASRSLGATHARILGRGILPNAIGPILVLATLGLGTAILSAAGLSFLGIGVETGTPEWGRMLRDGLVDFRRGPAMPIFAGAAISITVLAFNLLGDALRDALDPRTTQNSN